MRDVSSAFLDAVRGSHQMVARARLVTPGQTGTSPSGIFMPWDDATRSPTTWGEIPINTGSVVTDMNSDVQSTMSLTSGFDFPATGFSPGAPYGQECYIERGIEHGNGTREFVGLGYFRLDENGQDDAPDGVLDLSGSDRNANVRDSKPLFPYAFTASATFGNVIDLVVGNVTPGYVSEFDVSFDAYNTPIGTELVLDDDRMKLVNDLMSAFGTYGFFDYRGIYVVRDVPDPKKQKPVYLINSGKDGVLVKLSRRLSRDGVYNAVKASGQPVGDVAPVFGFAFDLDPASPTWYAGAFGLVPLLFESAAITSQAQALTAALAKLRKGIGMPFTVSLGTVPNPALEGWDVVAVQYDGGRQYETHVIDRIEYGLTPDDQMPMTTRKQFIGGDS